MGKRSGKSQSGGLGMTRMNYGKRFRGGMADSQYVYDSRIANDMAHRGHAKPGSMKQMVAQIHLRTSNEKRLVANREKKAAEIETAQGLQKQAYDTVVQALVLLDAALVDLNMAAQVHNSKDQREKELVFRVYLIDGITKLRKSIRMV